jgi:hypothetical protein
MKKLIFLLTSSLLLISCSPAWHLNRAIKKDPTIVRTQRDTIVKTVSDSGEVSFYQDTIIEDSLLFISVKHIDSKINLYWYLKSIKIEFPAEVTNIIPQPTNFRVWQDNKTKRTDIKQENKTDRKSLVEKTKQIKSGNKIEKAKLRVEQKKLNRFKIFMFGLIVGLILSQIPKLIKTIK